MNKIDKETTNVIQQIKLDSLILQQHNNNNNITRYYCKNNNNITSNNETKKIKYIEPDEEEEEEEEMYRNKKKKKKWRGPVGGGYESYNLEWYHFKGFEKIKTTPTGIASLDYKLLIGGLPFNHITELCGDSSTGKSTLSLRWMSLLQKQDSDAATLLIDSENSFTSDWATKCNVDLDRCYVAHPKNSDDCFEILFSSLEKKLFKMIVVDSFFSLIPNPKISSKYSLYSDDPKYTLNFALTYLKSLLKDSGCVLVIINQLRSNIIKPPSSTIKKIKIKERLELPTNNPTIDNPDISFANSIIDGLTDLKIEIQRDRYLFSSNDDEEISGIRTNVLIKKNSLLAHSDKSISTCKYHNQLLEFQSSFDIDYIDSINDDHEIIELSKTLNLLPSITEQQQQPNKSILLDRIKSIIN
ncbi:hypothetical protein DFA_09750 [Cavenderia fasciculata]|uniref:RecA-like N-terminal domain-containing protein n=1 Tax=Cavenderia fasciculata TaxID=261658 RepID=F4Q8H8_CACFS|nr:uncharacterized protein DFA_09750 [Cavenderia fasciculata]EGG16078.1 hypothetical protein DFA_09750 [Cavenderia fasciculata]|eukprot:XP_004352403.1 hypothetical protein DFA_09750 [Cavenderia fasciculata]